MKLEVGKKYVDNAGNIWTAVGKVPDLDEYILCRGAEDFNKFFFSDTDVWVGLDSTIWIKEEYVAPKTKDVWVVWHRDDTGDEFPDMFYVKPDDVWLEGCKKEGKEVLSIEKVTLTEGVFNVD